MINSENAKIYFLDTSKVLLVPNENASKSDKILFYSKYLWNISKIEVRETQKITQDIGLEPFSEKLNVTVREIDVHSMNWGRIALKVLAFMTAIIPLLALIPVLFFKKDNCSINDSLLQFSHNPDMHLEKMIQQKQLELWGCKDTYRQTHPHIYYEKSNLLEQLGLSVGGWTPMILLPLENMAVQIKNKRFESMLYLDTPLQDNVIQNKDFVSFFLNFLNSNNKHFSKFNLITHENLQKIINSNEEIKNEFKLYFNNIIPIETSFNSEVSDIKKVKQIHKLRFDHLEGVNTDDCTDFQMNPTQKKANDLIDKLKLLEGRVIGEYLNGWYYTNQKKLYKDVIQYASVEKISILIQQEYYNAFPECIKEELKYHTEPITKEIRTKKVLRKEFHIEENTPVTDLISCLSPEYSKKTYESAFKELEKLSFEFSCPDPKSVVKLNSVLSETCGQKPFEISKNIGDVGKTHEGAKVKYKTQVNGWKNLMQMIQRYHFLYDYSIKDMQMQKDEVEEIMNRLCQLIKCYCKKIPHHKWLTTEGREARVQFLLSKKLEKNCYIPLSEITDIDPVDKLFGLFPCVIGREQDERAIGEILEHANELETCLGDIQDRTSYEHIKSYFENNTNFPVNLFISIDELVSNAQPPSIAISPGLDIFGKKSVYQQQETHIFKLCFGKKESSVNEVLEYFAQKQTDTSLHTLLFLIEQGLINKQFQLCEAIFTIWEQCINNLNQKCSHGVKFNIESHKNLFNAANCLYKHAMEWNTLIIKKTDKIEMLKYFFGMDEKLWVLGRWYQNDFYDVFTYSDCANIKKCFANKSNRKRIIFISQVMFGYEDAKIYDEFQQFPQNQKQSNEIVDRLCSISNIQDLMNRLRWDGPFLYKSKKTLFQNLLNENNFFKLQQLCDRLYNDRTLIVKSGSGSCLEQLIQECSLSCQELSYLMKIKPEAISLNDQLLDKIASNLLDFKDPTQRLLALIDLAVSIGARGKEGSDFTEKFVNLMFEECKNIPDDWWCSENGIHLRMKMRLYPWIGRLYYLINTLYEFNPLIPHAVGSYEAENLVKNILLKGQDLNSQVQNFEKNGVKHEDYKLIEQQMDQLIKNTFCLSLDIDQELLNKQRHLFMEQKDYLISSEPEISAQAIKKCQLSEECSSAMPYLLIFLIIRCARKNHLELCRALINIWKPLTGGITSLHAWQKPFFERACQAHKHILGYEASDAGMSKERNSPSAED